MALAILGLRSSRIHNSFVSRRVGTSNQGFFVACRNISVDLLLEAAEWGPEKARLSWVRRRELQGVGPAKAVLRPREDSGKGFLYGLFR